LSDNDFEVNDFGCGFMTTFADGAEVHPDDLVTVKVYVAPAGRPVIVFVVPVPVVILLPGVLFKVQDPDEGRPLNTTLPVATLAVGCLIVPTLGAEGIDGGVLITILDEATDVHPEEEVTL
jgi:hypothetical protein